MVGDGLVVGEFRGEFLSEREALLMPRGASEFVYSGGPEGSIAAVEPRSRVTELLDFKFPKQRNSLRQGHQKDQA